MDAHEGPLTASGPQAPSGAPAAVPEYTASSGNGGSAPVTPLDANGSGPATHDGLHGSGGVGSHVGTMFGRDSLYMVASSLQLLAGVVITPIMTRVLGLHQYGIFAADLALLYVLYYTANLGLNVGIQRLYSQPDGERRSRNLLAAALVIVVVMTTLVYVTGPLWSPVLGFGAFPLSTQLTVVWSGLFAMSWICLAILRCNERLAVYSAVCFLQAIAGIGIGTLVAYFHMRQATDVLFCAVVVQAAAVLLALATITPIWRGIFDFPTIGETLAFSLPILPLQLSTFVLSASDRIIIQRDLGPSATGRYQVAYTLGAIGVSLLTFLNLAWLPRIFAISDRHTRAAVLAESRDGLYRLLVPVTIGMALGGPLVLRIWAPKSFDPAGLVTVVVLVVASTIPVCTAFVHSRLILSEGHSGYVALVTMAAALVNIDLNLALVPRMGINGSALATLITYGLLAMGMATVSRHLLPLARPRIGLWAQLLGATGLVLASQTVPIGVPWVGLRLVGSAVCLVWALTILRKLQLQGADR
ncbi:MAG: oligosaccharide flippase family protein [Acidimicrobiales bacterium]|nr:oligosaccharide flippase family protein [Acidimicrobiales bacterium]